GSVSVYPFTPFDLVVDLRRLRANHVCIALKPAELLAAVCFQIAMLAQPIPPGALTAAALRSRVHCGRRVAFCKPFSCANASRSSSVLQLPRVRLQPCSGLGSCNRSVTFPPSSSRPCRSLNATLKRASAARSSSVSSGGGGKATADAAAALSSLSL